MQGPRNGHSDTNSRTCCRFGLWWTQNSPFVWESYLISGKVSAPCHSRRTEELQPGYHLPAGVLKAKDVSQSQGTGEQAELNTWRGDWGPGRGREGIPDGQGYCTEDCGGSGHKPETSFSVFQS